MSQEEWRVIEEFPSYQISNLGNVFNTREHHIMRTSKTPFGHLKITLKSEDSSERFTRSVAILVAEAFVDIPNWLCDQVIILDGDLENVAAYNLAWRPRWYAWKYTHQLKTQQPIYYYNLPIRNVTTGRCYNNIIEAGVMEGLLFEEIWDSTYMKKKLFPHGFVFEVIQRV